MADRYEHHSHCVFNLGYHIIFCPKYHVHIFIKTPPTLAIDKLVQGLKGYTANVLRHERPWLQKIKTLWSPSYYAESIGHISEETVRRYIEEQKETAQRKAGSLSSHG